MSRTAQDVLEFDGLRELLRLRTTCASGRRAVHALEPGMERAALESAFALIREAAEWLRAGRELGFGALSDPQGWLERIEGLGAALEPGEFLDVVSLLETAGWLRQQFREEAMNFRLLAARAAALRACPFPAAVAVVSRPRGHAQRQGPRGGDRPGDRGHRRDAGRRSRPRRVGVGGQPLLGILSLERQDS